MYRMNNEAIIENSTLAVVKNGNSENCTIATLSNGENILSWSVLNKFFSYLDISAVSVHSYISGIKQFVKYLNEQDIKIPNRDNVLMFKRELITKGRKPSTVALYLSAIRRFFEWCESEGLYSNITRGVKAPRPERGHKRDALSGAQIRECLQCFNRETEQGKRDYAVFLLMSTCGLRTIEIVRADCGDIHEVQGVALLSVHGKGASGKDNFVKLSAPVLDAIRDYLATRGQVKETEPLFASCSKRNRGQRLTTRTISSIAKSSMRKAGYNSSRLTAHSLRHSAATLAIQAGLSLQEVSAFLRHSNINVTMVYLHDVNRLKSQCENAVTTAIFAA